MPSPMTWLINNAIPRPLVLGLTLLMASALLQDVPLAAGADKASEVYDVIAKKDPFDPARGQGEYPELDNFVSEGGLKDRFQVYGTIIVGNKRRAFLKVKSPQGPGIKRKRDQKQLIRTVSIGDLVDGWKIVGITNKGIVLESEDEKVFIGVFETLKKERASATPVDLGVPGTKPNKPTGYQEKVSKDRGPKNKGRPAITSPGPLPSPPQGAGSR